MSTSDINGIYVFGDIENPETDDIDVPLGGSWQCPCGCVMELSGFWLAAHWNEKLERICDNLKCKQRFNVRAGRIRLRGKPYGTTKHVFGIS